MTSSLWGGSKILDKTLLILRAKPYECLEGERGFKNPDFSQTSFKNDPFSIFKSKFTDLKIKNLHANCLHKKFSLSAILK